MKKLYWDWNYQNFEELHVHTPELSDVIVPCSAVSSPWWKGLPSFTNGMKSMKDVIKNLSIEKFHKMGEKRRNEFRWAGASPGEKKTMKWCPGVTQLFETSFMLKCPCDVTIQINRSMDFVVHNSVDDILGVGGHQFDQMRSEYNMFKGKFNIKFTLPVRTSNDQNIPYIFTNPSYHADTIWDVIPGVIGKRYTKGLPLIVNTLVDVNDLVFDEDDIATIEIKKGAVLSYIWFPEKMKLVHAPGKVKSRSRAKL